MFSRVIADSQNTNLLPLYNVANRGGGGGLGTRIDDELPRNSDIHTLSGKKFVKILHPVTVIVINALVMEQWNFYCFTGFHCFVTIRYPKQKVCL